MADKRLVDARGAYIRRLLARGVFVHEIIDQCEQSDLFDDVRSAASPKHVRYRKLTRRTIRLIIYDVKKEQRERLYDTGTEIAEAHDRLLLVIAKAFKDGDNVAIIGAQRVINKMLGLRRQQEPELISADDLAQQVADMDRTIGLPSDDA